MTANVTQEGDEGQGTACPLVKQDFIESRMILKQRCRCGLDRPGDVGRRVSATQARQQGQGSGDVADRAQQYDENALWREGHRQGGNG